MFSISSCNENWLYVCELYVYELYIFPPILLSRKRPTKCVTIVPTVSLSCRSRSSHRRCSVKKGILRNFAKFTGKHMCQSLFFNKVAGLSTATLLKKRLWHWCFPVNFAKFLRTPFPQNASGRLLLQEN